MTECSGEYFISSSARLTLDGGAGTYSIYGRMQEIEPGDVLSVLNSDFSLVYLRDRTACECTQEIGLGGDLECPNPHGERGQPAGCATVAWSSIKLR